MCFVRKLYNRSLERHATRLTRLGEDNMAPLMWCWKSTFQSGKCGFTRAGGLIVVLGVMLGVVLGVVLGAELCAELCVVVSEENVELVVVNIVVVSSGSM